MDFECGYGDSLATWLRDYGARWQAEDLCTTWVLGLLNDESAVRGYFTLSAHNVATANIGKAHRAVDRNNREWANGVTRAPAQLLGKFALDVSCQGKGLGDLLMLSVYEHYLAACDHTASKYLVVEARESELAEYYSSRFNFIPARRNDELTMLYLTSAAIRNNMAAVLSGDCAW